MSFPLPPQLLAPQMGMRGGTGGGAGGMGPGAGIATAAIAGIGGLLNGLAAKRKREKQEAATTFKTGMEMLAQGIPGVDMDKVAKAAKKLGMPLDFEGKGAAPQAGPAATMPSPMPGGGNVNGGVPAPSPAVAAVLAAAQNAGSQGTPQPARPTGIVGSNYALASPAGHGLAQVYGRAQEQRSAAHQAKMLELQTNMAKLRLLGTAITDLAAGNENSQAARTASRIPGLLHPPQGVDSVYALASRVFKGDASKMEAFGKQYVNHLIGQDDMDRAREQMRAQADKQRGDFMIKVLDQATDMVRNSENMDLGSAMGIITSQYSDDPEKVKAGQAFAKQFKTSKQGDAERELVRMYGVDKNGNLTLDAHRFQNDVARLALERQRVGLEGARVGMEGQRLKLATIEVANGIQRDLYKADSDAYNKNMQIYLNKDLPEKDRNAAAERVANASRRMGERELRIPGMDKPIKMPADAINAETIGRFWMWQDDYLQLTNAPSVGFNEKFGDLTGTPSGAKPTTGPVAPRSTIPLNVPYPHSGISSLPAGAPAGFDANSYIRAFLEQQMQTPTAAASALLSGGRR